MATTKRKTTKRSTPHALALEEIAALWRTVTAQVRAASVQHAAQAVQALDADLAGQLVALGDRLRASATLALEQASALNWMRTHPLRRRRAPQRRVH
jgi:hypothetical protein